MQAFTSFQTTWTVLKCSLGVKLRNARIYFYKIIYKRENKIGNIELEIETGVLDI
jgi:hypothetical protein